MINYALIFTYYSILLFPHILPIILSKVPIMLLHLSYYSFFFLAYWSVQWTDSAIIIVIFRVLHDYI